MNDQQQRELAAGLEALADSTRYASASRRVEEALMAEMGRLKPAPTRHAREHVAREHVARPTSHVARPTSHVARPTSHVARPTSHVPRRTSHVARGRSPFFALAAMLLLAVGGALWMARSTPGPEVFESDGFVALPGAAALPDIESANIVRVSLSVAALPAYGVAILPEMQSGSVEAELLVAQDGQARAIRLVTESDDSRSVDND